MNVDELLKRSRRMRDTLDEAGIATREQKAWDDRYLRVWKTPSGQVHIHGLFPPEQGEFIALGLRQPHRPAPRRRAVRRPGPGRVGQGRAGGPAQHRADRRRHLHRPAQGRQRGQPEPDARRPHPRRAGARQRHTPRTHPDTAVQTVDPTDGTRARSPTAPGTASSRAPRTGLSARPSTGSSAHSGTVEVTFDADGQPLNLGREERIFSPAQRIALAARDGGCRWGDCDRPPSRTEAHHLDEWVRDHGATDIRVGILLCPPHHRLLHAQGWQIFEHHGAGTGCGHRHPSTPARP